MKKKCLLLLAVLALTLATVACDNGGDGPVIDPGRDLSDGDWVEENSPLLDAARDCAERQCLAEPIGKAVTDGNYSLPSE